VIIQALLDVVCYESPVQVVAANSALEELTVAVNSEVASWNADDGNYGKTFRSISKKAISVVEVRLNLNCSSVSIKFLLVLLFLSKFRGKTRFRHVCVVRREL
jgi:hypothetical protein